MDSCIFCKIVKKEIPSSLVYEDDFCIAFLDIRPINLGHTLLVPKQHYKNLYELPDELLKKLPIPLRNLSIAIKKATEANGINIGMNNDRPAGQIIDHAHIHIIPRFSNDGLLHWPGKEFSNEEIRKTSADIKRVL